MAAAGVAGVVSGYNSGNGMSLDCTAKDPGFVESAKD